MIEIPPESFDKVSELFHAARFGALTAATIEGGHPGRLFVDHPDNPQTALLCTRVGYYFLAGGPGGPEFLDWLGAAFSQELIPQQFAATGEQECLLFYPDASWRDPLAEALAEFHPKLLRKKRMVYDASASITVPGPLPEHYQLVFYDAALLEHNHDLAAEVTLFFGSVQAFIARSLGCAVLTPAGTVASSCHAVLIGAGEAEISVATAPEYRRRGFARRTAWEFMNACHSRGLTPVWGCFPENTPSVRLAYSLGFRDQIDQPFYLFQQRNGG